jgi:replicative DNA helicase
MSDPKNIEAERALLARVLADQNAFWDVSDEIVVGDIADPLNAAIWRGVVELANSGKEITPPLLQGQVAWDDSIALAATVAALLAHGRELLGIDVSQLVQAVRHAAARRAMILAGEEIVARAKTATLSVSTDELRDDAVKLLTSTIREASQDAVSIHDLVARVINNANAALESGKPVGVKSGFETFDDVVGSLLPGNLIVLGGETGAGKTALATQLAAMVAEQGIPVDFYSQEMDGGEIAARLLAKWSQVPVERIAAGDLRDTHVQRMFNAGQRFLDMPLYIDSTASLTVASLYARIARGKAKRGTKLAVIDHLQFMRADNRKSRENEQVRQCVDGVKEIAKRLGLPIILLSHVSRTGGEHAQQQINRASDVRRPTLRDLYGSSAIEKAADAVVFVHRPHWFLERSTPASRFQLDWEGDCLAWENKAELIVPKRRSGRGFAVRRCEFDSTLTWFRDD